MEYRNGQRGEFNVLIPQGSLKTAEAPRFQEEINRMLGDKPRLCVDFEEVDYICSSGLRVLLAAQQRVDDLEDGELILTHVGGEVMRVLESTGFVNLLEIR